MQENPEIQVGLNLDLSQFEQQLTSAEAQLLQRMNGAEVQPPAGLPLPPPAPAAPPPAPIPTGAGSDNPIASAWQELERLKSLSSASPEIALAGLRGVSGSGGLYASVAKSAVANPEDAEQYQQLLTSIRELSKSLRESVSESQETRKDPATGMLSFMRNDMRMRAIGMVAGDLQNGDILSAGTSGIGGLIGSLGGPAGAMAGAQIGQMVGSMASGFLQKTREASEYGLQVTDINARFGNIGAPDALSPQALANKNLSGYSPTETAQLVDALRQAHVVKDMDDRAVEMARSIQELTRATGENTEVLTQNYASYRTSGGQDTAEGYTAQMIAGAVSVGMRQNLAEYMEIVGSARGSLVMRSFQADEGDVGMRGIQGMLTNLMGAGNRTSDLLQQNPQLAQQMISSFLATGGAQAFSLGQAQMRLAGVGLGETDEAFLSPEQRVENAARRQAFVAQQSIFSDVGLGLLGMNREQLTEQLKQDPNFLQEALSGDALPAQQKQALQDYIQMQYQGQFGKTAGAGDMQMLLQVATSIGRNNGVLDLSAPMADGKSLGDLLGQSKETEAAKFREAQENMTKVMLQLYDVFKEYQPQLTNAMTGLIRVVAENAPEIKRVMDTVGGWLTENGPQVLQALEKTAGAINWLAGLIPGGSSGGGIAGAAGSVLGAVANPIGALTKIADAAAGGALSGAADQGIKAGPTIAKVAAAAANPIGAAIDLGSFTFSKGLEAVHDLFNDTPPGGVVAGPGYDTFRFAHGDLVQAQMGGGGGGSAPSVNINLNLSVPSGADAGWVGSAARQGTQAAMDEWLIQWESGSLQPRNQPRIANRMY